DGHAAPPPGAAVPTERGIDLSAHVSRRITRAGVARADVILAMTRKHGWAVTAHDADAADRTFLVAELIRLARGQRPNGESVRQWAESIGQSRRPDRPIGHAGDEITDPVGESIEVYRATASLLDRWLGELAAVLNGN